MWQTIVSARFQPILGILTALPVAALLPFAPAIAEITPSELQNSPTMISLQFPPGSGSAPKRTAGAGVRGNCAPGLTAIVPDSSVSMTVNEETTFFVYIPQTDALIGSFTLNLSTDGSQTYTDEILLSGEPGVVSFTLPQEIALANDAPYNWKFTLYCDGIPGTTVGNVAGSEQRVSSVSGQVQRMELTPELRARLDNATTPLETAEVYAEAGVWHETMAILSELRSSNPQQWQEFLTSVGLDSVAQAPFVE